MVVNGERAWSVLQERDAPRLAIIDQRLPGLNGIEICKRLRARRDPFYTFLLLLMPNTYRVEHLLALESGADDCIAKPFNQEELCARVEIGRRVLGIDQHLTEINSRWRAMLDALPFGVATVDERGILKRVNCTFARQMGYTHPQQLLGQSLDRLLRERIDLHGVLDQIAWREPFDNVEVTRRALRARSTTIRLWGRAITGNPEAVYELVVQEPQ